MAVNKRMARNLLEYKRLSTFFVKQVVRFIVNSLETLTLLHYL